ncbi:hypothetical protein D3C72_1992690 [compost metagenome]
MVMMLTTPAMALAPQNVLCGPRRISIRSMSSATSPPKSNSPCETSFASTPSIMTSNWLPSAPRTRTCVRPPDAPVRETEKPGTRRRASAT